LKGTGQKGDWEMFRVEIRGAGGRVQLATLNDPAGIPAIGEFCMLPVIVGTNGYLRVARHLDTAAF